jgi:hypothetical protein
MARPTTPVRRVLREDEDRSTSFSSILDQQVEDAERPKPLPAGSYICVIPALPRFDKSSKKQTDFVEFALQPLDVLTDKDGKTDVDVDALEAMGGLENRTLRATFYITEEAKWRLRKFLEDLGLDVKGKSFHECISESPGCQVVAHVIHEPSADGQSFYATVKSTAAAQ